MSFKSSNLKSLLPPKKISAKSIPKGKDTPLKQMIKEKSGSSLHKSLANETALKVLGAKKTDVVGLPHKLPPRPKNITNGDVKYARLESSKKPEKPFYKDPQEVSPEFPQKRKAGGSAKGGMWIQKAIKHPGALHKTLKVPMGQKIPLPKLEKAEHSKSPLTRKRADLAMTLKGFKK